MSGHNLGIILVRLFAIYLAITALQNLFLYLPTMLQGAIKAPDWFLSIQFWMPAFGFALPAVCAFLIWRFAETFVPEQTVAIEDSISAPQLMLVGTSLLGLYFLTWGAISLVRVESSFAASEHFDNLTKWAQRVPYLVQMLVATAMLLGRKRLANVLLKAKNAGTGRV